VSGLHTRHSIPKRSMQTSECARTESTSLGTDCHTRGCRDRRCLDCSSSWVVAGREEVMVRVSGHMLAVGILGAVIPDGGGSLCLYCLPLGWVRGRGAPDVLMVLSPEVIVCWRARAAAWLLWAVGVSGCASFYATA
jgi:hypothetical protein